MEDKIIVISILSYYAKQIFAGNKKFEFRKSPIKHNDLGKTFYVYSAKQDKAIIGSFKVSKVHKGNLDDILDITGYNQRNDKKEIIDYYKNSNTCYALELTDIIKFHKPLSLNDMRKIDRYIQLPQYYAYLSPKSPLCNVIKNLH